MKHGGKAITTDAIGGIDIGMLIDVLGRMGITMRSCMANRMGFYRVVLSQQGIKRGDACVESEAVAASRESATVDATLAALLIHPPR